MSRLFAAIVCIAALAACNTQQNTQWPQAGIEAKPGTRWWWMGSAVDSANIATLMQQYAQAGIGTVEITPIYGVQGNDSAEIKYLSTKWMQMYNFVQQQAAQHGMVVDMNNGTGWPFGGPSVTLDDAARRFVIETYSLSAGQTLMDTIAPADRRQRRTAQLMRLMAFSDNGQCKDLTANVSADKTLQWTAEEGQWTLYAVFCGHTFQKVKRAAPGGEGYVMNHFSKTAVDNYLKTFSDAFKQNAAKAPHNFFNDSYEVYHADCTPDIFEQFEQRRGYKLEEHLPQFLAEKENDTMARLMTDYCLTLSELLLENFTSEWTAWAHAQGSQTRNQAHGSPANLIDIYAAVDVPECEGFGLTDFGIKGLRRDSLVRRNDSDLSMLKYASSAAHIAGRRLTSSETFTWLTEHFRTSLAQCKPDLDLMFVSGVNHVYFHGTTYSPAEAEWPGWKFYATVDMSPTNPLWRDCPPFFKYIERAQSFLQYGSPDNDFLVYLPIYDIWHEQAERLLQLSIHDMAHRAPKFIEVINSINAAGFDVDYISDKFLLSATVNADGTIKTSGGANYKAIVVPAVAHMPADVFEHLADMARKGATVVISEHYPQSAPGLSNFDQNAKRYETIVAGLPQSDFGTTQTTALGKGRLITGNNYAQMLTATGVRPEAMKNQCRLHCIRRTNETGHHYFISNLTGNDVDEWIEPAVDFQSAMFFDPMTGETGKASAQKSADGRTQVRLQLASGQSVILKTFNATDVQADAWHYHAEGGSAITIDKGWSVRFVQSTPAIADTFRIDTLCAWTEIDDPRCRTNMGTALYTAQFDMAIDPAKRYLLDLDDVRETARVRINGHEVATLWAVPYRCQVEKYLQNGTNTIEIEVTGLPANRIAELDRQGTPWRKFKEINMVDINYKRTTYAHWATMPAGLNGTVRIIEN